MDKLHKRENAYFRKIMVGYDGSKPADQAVEIAFSPAESTDCNELIFSVARPPGRRGMSRFEKMLVGWTSEKVLRYAHCPVMVVR